MWGRAGWGGLQALKGRLIAVHERTHCHAISHIASNASWFDLCSVHAVAMQAGVPTSGTSVYSVGASLEVPTGAQLLRAIAAAAVCGARCAWVSVVRLCDILNIPKRVLMSAVQRNSWWCTHINGYVIAKNQQAIFADTAEKITDAPRDMLALAQAMASGLQSWVTKQALVR